MKKLKKTLLLIFAKWELKVVLSARLSPVYVVNIMAKTQLPVRLQLHNL